MNLRIRRKKSKVCYLFLQRCIIKSLENGYKLWGDAEKELEELKTLYRSGRIPFHPELKYSPPKNSPSPAQVIKEVRLSFES